MIIFVALFMISINLILRSVMSVTDTRSFNGLIKHLVKLHLVEYKFDITRKLLNRRFDNVL